MIPDITSLVSLNTITYRGFNIQIPKIEYSNYSYDRAITSWRDQIDEALTQLKKEEEEYIASLIPKVNPVDSVNTNEMG